MSLKLALLVGAAVSSVVPMAAHAQVEAASPAPVELSSQDLAYVTAQEIRFEQDTFQTLCKRSSHGKEIKRRDAEFEAANPEYAPALAARPTDPAAAARAEKLIKGYQDGVGMILRMGMPAELFCASAVRSEPESFAARVEKVRAVAAKADPPPPPADPDAGLPEVRLSAADLDEVVRQVLQHADVAMYLHPDSPGRVPVRVALAAPYASEKPDFALYGQPVRSAPIGDRSAVQLTIRATEKTAKVTVAYALEGIHGTVRLARDGTTWRITEAKIYE